MSEIARATHERDKLILQASHAGFTAEQISKIIDRSTDVVERIIYEDHKRRFLMQQKQQQRKASDVQTDTTESRDSAH